MKASFIDCSVSTRQLLESAAPELLSDVDIHVGDPVEHDELVRRIRGATAIVNGHTNMDRALFASLGDELRSIIFLGTGASSYIDLDAAHERDIQVRVIRSYGDRTIAEHAFALMLSAARNVVAADRGVRKGDWPRPRAFELFGKTVGIVGFGGVGTEFASLCYGFGMSVAGWNRSPVDVDVPVEWMDADEVFARADVVSLHLALTPETKHFVNSRRLDLMRAKSVLINTARGDLIDEAALVRKLKGRDLSHAALDVFASEPLPSDSPFLELDNVTLTAHNAWDTPEASGRLLRSGFEILQEDLATLSRGEPLTSRS
ncbi:MAG: 3-phosphoglycerate dehydrogenase [Gammaproteobacteria bacterium]|nr:3-phosphoglycerate dehydrogenase [Gammaproteobacteria bacterium]